MDSTSSSSPDPPSYETVIDHRRRDQLPSDELPSLILDGCLIYPATPPSRALYELSNPPCEAKKTIYGVEKIRYKVQTSDEEGAVKPENDHIYDFKNHYFGMTSSHMIIEGKTSQKRTFREVFMSPGLGSNIWKVPGHFKIDRGGLLGHLKHKNEISWKDEDGRLLAVETRTARRKDGTLDGLPRLDLKVQLDDKTLDLLVTCWAARLWKEGQKDLAETMTWDKFKRIASVKTGAQGLTPYPKA